MQHYMREHGTSYYLANRFFPKEIKKDVFALYAFVRIPDDVVDEPWVDPVWARKELERMWWVFERLHQELSLNPSHWGEDPLWEWKQVAYAAAHLFHKKWIPIERAKDFFAAMYADLDKKVYTSYIELQWYMYGSAEVVGLMMCKIIGYDDAQEEEVFRTAKLLWEAMQYTNFLRDIKEDLLEYDRMYIPEDRLIQHDLNHVLLTQYIGNKPVDERWQKCMSAQVLQCKELYREANKGIALLDPQWRRAVRIASWMYESILDKIVRHEYDVFSYSARTTPWEKLRALLSKSRHYAMGHLD